MKLSRRQLRTVQKLFDDKVQHETDSLQGRDQQIGYLRALACVMDLSFEEAEERSRRRIERALSNKSWLYLSIMAGRLVG